MSYQLPSTANMPLKIPVKCKVPECSEMTRSSTRYCVAHSHLQERHEIGIRGTAFGQRTDVFRRKQKYGLGG